MACAPDYDLQMDLQTVPPAPVSLDGEVIINEGIAVAVIARPLDGGDIMDAETVVDLRSSNPSILRVEVVDDMDFHPEDGEWGFAIWGASVGQTEMIVLFDREEVLRLPATVQPAK